MFSYFLQNMVKFSKEEINQQREKTFPKYMYLLWQIFEPLVQIYFIIPLFKKMGQKQKQNKTNTQKTLFDDF